MENNIVNAVHKVDQAFVFIFGISFLMLFLISVAALWFLYKYNKKRNPVASDIEGNVVAEVIWTVIPTILVFAMFWFGWTGYKALRDAPENSMNISVEARMWSWKFIYDNERTSDKLYVPENTPIKLNMTSKDVIHSFYAPAFRIKMDTVPGMMTYVWFYSGEPAQYEILCAEYCGLRHSYMLSKIIVLPKDEFEQWLLTESNASDIPPAMQIMEEYGCLDCHSLDGEIIVGPSFKDMYGQKTTVIVKGEEKTILVDEAYIKESIKDPSAAIVKGYDDIMPATEEMTDEQINIFIEFLKGGLQTKVKGVSGKKILENEGCMDCHSTDGSIIVGPSFKGLYGKTYTVKHNGKDVEIKMDRDFLKTALEDPDEYIPEGFEAGIMPPFNLSDEDFDAVVEYLETLKD